MGLHCMVPSDPLLWSKELIWVEYAHNSLHIAGIEGLSPFHCGYSYQLPSFPELEEKVVVPGAPQQHLTPRYFQCIIKSES